MPALPFQTEAVWFAAFLAISFACVAIIREFNKRGKMTGIDVNKAGKPVIPESAGIALLIPLLVAVALLLQWQKQLDLISWFALAAFFCVVGFADDWCKSRKIHVSWLLRALPIGLASLLFAGVYAWNPVWVVPLALFLTGMASFQNTFAGLNGMEIGCAFLISVFQVSVLWSTELKWMALALSAAILGLLLWNRFPAKVFPGDSGTLLIGAALGGLFLLSGNEKNIAFGALLFLPHALD